MSNVCMCVRVCVSVCLKSLQQLRAYEDGPQAKVPSGRLGKPGIEPATHGLQGELFYHYTTVASIYF